MADVLDPKNWREMSLDMGLMFGYHISMMVMMVAGGSLTVRQELTIAAAIAALILIASRYRRQQRHWRWPGIKPVNVLYALILVRCRAREDRLLRVDRGLAILKPILYLRPAVGEGPGPAPPKFSWCLVIWVMRSEAIDWVPIMIAILAPLMLAAAVQHRQRTFG
jgi:hypothetical protein